MELVLRNTLDVAVRNTFLDVRNASLRRSRSWAPGDQVPRPVLLISEASTRTNSESHSSSDTPSEWGDLEKSSEASRRQPSSPSSSKGGA